MVGRLNFGLFKTRNNLVGKIVDVIKASPDIDDDVYDELEEILIEADVGVGTSSKLIENLKKKIDELGIRKSENIINFLKYAVKGLIESNSSREAAVRLFEFDVKPLVIMIVGVNGTGKTTSIGKLAYHYKKMNKKVLLSAADTFRAAASEQLEIWSDRAGVDVVRNQPGADPASVAYDSLQAAIKRDIDVLIVDTAGRLHTKVNLMEELKKIKRVLKKLDETSPHVTLLVLDATTGQNGLNQAKQFTQSIGVDGIILTKLDGTAKGGVILSINDELGVPVKFIGIGEQLDDLQPFDAQEFVEALFQ
ncbi:signal recognition particle-docking protein FtsY [candidate division KSB1 bacterium]|nr:signal recognition particle-docking protein FtsY [candidate division KSB1 bacterium]